MRKNGGVDLFLMTFKIVLERPAFARLTGRPNGKNVLVGNLDASIETLNGVEQYWPIRMLLQYPR